MHKRLMLTHVNPILGSFLDVSTLLLLTIPGPKTALMSLISCHAIITYGFDPKKRSKISTFTHDLFIYDNSYISTHEKSFCTKRYQKNRKKISSNHHREMKKHYVVT